MIYLILSLIFLSAPVTYPPLPKQVFVLRGVANIMPETRSCGAAPRMLRDRHRLVYVNDEVYVNGLKWEIDPVSHFPNDMIITFHDVPGSKVIIWMALWSNDRKIMGYYSIWGTAPDGDFCSDTVTVEGVRVP